MTRFSLRVWRTIGKHELIGPGDRVIAACSGGADSTALLFVLIDLAPIIGCELAGIVHVHHGLRGAEADADLEFCQALAERLSLPFRGMRVDVPGEALRRRWSMERTAHALRHGALRAAAKELSASRIALGHTRDDQAETVVLRFLRGAGTRGMAGMWPRRGACVRPMLEVSRTSVEQFLRSRGLIFRVDGSNADCRIPRNRVRHEVLPALVAVAGVGLPARLARQAEGWRADERWLEESAAPWVARTLQQTSSGWLIRLDELLLAPDALLGRIRLGWLGALVPGRISSSQVDHLGRLERMEEGRVARLGGWQVRRSGSRLVLARALPSTAAPDDVAVAGASWGPLTLPVPGQLEESISGLRMSAEISARDVMTEHPARLGSSRAMLDADALPGRLLVRSWVPGDRLRPIGLGGSQKVQDLLVNRKVPRDSRSAVPIVTTPDGRVVWVAGFAVAEEFAVKTSTNRVVTLKATHPGGKA